MKMPIAIALCMGLTAFTPEFHQSTKSDTNSEMQLGFSALRGHRQGKGTMLMWSMMNNSIYQDFKIESTYEDPTDPYSVWVTRGIVNKILHDPMVQLRAQQDLEARRQAMQTLQTLFNLDVDVNQQYS